MCFVSCSVFSLLAAATTILECCSPRVVGGRGKRQGRAVFARNHQLRFDVDLIFECSISRVSVRCSIGLSIWFGRSHHRSFYLYWFCLGEVITTLFISAGFVWAKLSLPLLLSPVLFGRSYEIPLYFHWFSLGDTMIFPATPFILAIAI